MLIYGVQPRLTWLLLPVIVLVLASSHRAACAMLLSALYVRYRDVAPIWGVISQALFYASPVFITDRGDREARHCGHPLLPVQPAGGDPPAGPPLDDRRQPAARRR